MIATLVFYKAGQETIVEEKPVVFTPQNGANREVPQAKEELIEIFWQHKYNNKC